MKALYTIGYTKKSLRDFIGRIRDAAVDCVVDIRLNNTSQLAGFAKRDDLEFLLKGGFAIRYAHMVDLAPSKDLLDDYKLRKDWDDYVERFGRLIDERGMVDEFLRAAADGRWEKPCLLCSEDKPDQCHRRLLAEALQARMAGLEVRHL